MTEHFQHVQQSGALGLDGALPILPAPTSVAVARTPVGAGDDPFLCQVSDPGLDLLLLHQYAQPLHGLDAFQLLLRALCASGRKVDRAGLVNGYISLKVDDVALAHGADRLPERHNGVFSGQRANTVRASLGGCDDPGCVRRGLDVGSDGRVILTALGAIESGAA